MPRPLSLAAVLSLPALFLLAGCSGPEGEEIFRREGCTVCHSFGGHGVDLTGVTERRSDIWIKEQIRYPRIHDPHTGMPSFNHLSDREIEALISYLGEGE
jgi:cbb3-type cytochrome oxidase cytochrome c subunit